jgi:hypothetical protein
MRDTILCILAKDFIHPVWVEWIQSDPSMGVVIHQKEMASNNSSSSVYWNDKVVSRIHPTSWGDASLVIAELQMYRDGLERFPDAKRCTTPFVPCS